MDEQVFYKTINSKAKELGLDPLLIISGIEGLYAFRNTPLTEANFTLLDNLILSILALRIGDQFHQIAEKNLSSSSNEVRIAADLELKELDEEEIKQSSNPFFQSFAGIVNGKTAIRKYHEKALDAAALEVKNAQVLYQNNSIGAIVLHICKENLNDSLDLGAFLEVRI